MNTRPLFFLAVLAALIAVSPARAQDAYPKNVIHVICNFPPGNGSDFAVRFFAQQLGEVSGATVIVENKVGAFGMMGARTVAEAKPDGYTVFISGVSTVISGARYLYKDVPYNPDKDFQAVARLFKLPFVMTVDPKLPLNSVADVTAYLKSGKAKNSYGSAANPGTISAEMYLARANLRPERVNYRDAKQAQTEMLNGLLDFVFFDAGSTTSQVTENRIRALAVTSAERLPALPDVPTMAESGFPGYEMILTWGVVVPAGTPDPVVSKLESWFAEILARPKAKEFIVRMGGIPYPGDRKALDETIKKEVANWAEYVKLADIKPQ
ncbi:MAG: Bug family tripartite tricarboxylate transporter substrate binding protein [Xanthobacteraceae bacterium]